VAPAHSRIGAHLSRELRVRKRKAAYAAMKIDVIIIISATTRVAIAVFV
jgi:hypothetical protein